MKRNVITAVFDTDSEAYQALSDLRRDHSNADYRISNAALVIKNGETLQVCDGFDTGEYGLTHARKGWIIGMVIGCFTGFYGMLLCAASFWLIGSFRDRKEVKMNSAVMQRYAKEFPDGRTALLVLASEENTFAIDRKLSHYENVIERFDAEAAEAEITQQKKLQKQQMTNV